MYNAANAATTTTTVSMVYYFCLLLYVPGEFLFLLFFFNSLIISGLMSRRYRHVFIHGQAASQDSVHYQVDRHSYRHATKDR